MVYPESEMQTDLRLTKKSPKFVKVVLKTLFELTTVFVQPLRFYLSLSISCRRYKQRKFRRMLRTKIVYSDYKIVLHAQFSSDFFSVFLYDGKHVADFGFLLEIQENGKKCKPFFYLLTCAFIKKGNKHSEQWLVDVYLLSTFTLPDRP